LGKRDFRPDPAISNVYPLIDLNDGSVSLQHVDFPGVWFRLSFSRDGRLVGLEVSLDEREESAITRTLVKAVPVTLLEREARRLLRWAATDLGGRIDLGPGAHPMAVSIAVPPDLVQSAARDQDYVDRLSSHATRPDRSRTRDDRWYAQLAAAYVAALEAGEATNRALARDWGFSEATIRNAVWEARRRGFLTPTKQGRQGGQLTPKTVELLMEQET
jgi:hypothetical protein